MSVCPKCRSAHVEQLTTQRRDKVWYECRACRHLWNEEPKAPAYRCSKCRSGDVTISRSPEPMLIFIRCGACGYSSTVVGT